ESCPRYHIKQGSSVTYWSAFFAFGRSPSDMQAPRASRVRALRQVLAPVLYPNLCLDGLYNLENQSDKRLLLGILTAGCTGFGQEYVHDVFNKSMVGRGGKVVQNLMNYVSHDIPDGIFQGVLNGGRSEEHTSELQSRENLVCSL